MTLDELELSLPNGLHDGRLRALCIDYTRSEMTLDIDINVGIATLLLRRGSILFSGLLFCAINPPDRRYLDKSTGTSLLIDTGPFKGLKNFPPALPTDLPEGFFGNWIFVNNSNFLMYIAARSVRLEWQEEEVAQKA